MTTPGTPREAIDKLHAAVVAITAQPDVREWLANFSMEAVSTTPTDYQKLIAGDVEKWGKVLRESNLVIE